MSHLDKYKLHAIQVRKILDVVPCDAVDDYVNKFYFRFVVYWHAGCIINGCPVAQGKLDIHLYCAGRFCQVLAWPATLFSGLDISSEYTVSSGRQLNGLSARQGLSGCDIDGCPVVRDKENFHTDK